MWLQIVTITICCLLDLGSAWSQPNYCYVRQSTCSGGLEQPLERIEKTLQVIATSLDRIAGEVTQTAIIPIMFISIIIDLLKLAPNGYESWLHSWAVMFSLDPLKSGACIAQALSLTRSVNLILQEKSGIQTLVVYYVGKKKFFFLGGGGGGALLTHSSEVVYLADSLRQAPNYAQSCWLYISC